jgi:poly-beta-1,6-N-acetyl-D-glucosamine synthase
MHEVLRLVCYIIDNILLYYTIVIISIYLILATTSAFIILKYLRQKEFFDYNPILSSPLAPGISVIVPLTEECRNFAKNIKALLLLYYSDYEVIIVNDGCTDDFLQKITETFNLEQVNFFVNYRIETKMVKSVYKSHDKTYKNLLVVVKEKGGRADALNAGINISSKQYFICLDKDSVLESDSLLKLVKPFMEETDKKVIATGAMTGISNSCLIENGQIIRINIPEKILPRFQALEYLRSFFLSRAAWNRFNGLRSISVAISMLDREIVIGCGGYYDQTSGEDMELLVRMRRYMHANKMKYRIVYIPELLGRIKCPDTYSDYERRRNNWTRGSIDTLFIHRKIFFNPKYGLMGLLSYPFHLFFEWLSPIVVTFGLFYFLLLGIFGFINWSFFLLLCIFIYLFSVFMTVYSIFFEQLTYRQYNKITDIFKLILIALIEPFTYQFIKLWIAIKSNYMYFLLGVKTSDILKRRGFVKIKFDIL